MTECTWSFQQSRTNWDANAFKNDLWVINKGESRPNRLTTPNKSATDAAWSPDGRWIAFLSDRPGTLPKSAADKRQIYLAPAQGGESVQLTKIETGINHFESPPDGKSIAFTSGDPDTKERKDRKESFGEYHIIHGDYAMVHLWLIDVPDDPGTTHPKPARIPEGSFTVAAFRFSPDGKQIAFAAQRDPDLLSSFTSDIYTVILTGHTVNRIVDTAGPDESPSWSPDGRQIAFVTCNADSHFFFSNRKIAVVPSGGSGKAAVVNEQFDEDADLTAWMGEGIFFTGYEHGIPRLFRLNPAAKSLMAVSPDRQYVSAVSIAPDGRHVAYRGATSAQLPEIFTAELTGSAITSPTQLRHTDGQLGPFSRSTREIVTWNYGDGAMVEGILERPADFNPVACIRCS